MATDFPNNPSHGDVFGAFTYDENVPGWRSNPETASGMPAGSIMAWGSDVAPVNWLICNGSAVSRTTYASLFATIGVTYGVGDGATTFNLPDLRGKVPVGKDSTQTEFDILGEAGGNKATAKYGDGTSTGYGATYSSSLGAGDLTASNLQPYQVVNYIIKSSAGTSAGDSELATRVGSTEAVNTTQNTRLTSLEYRSPNYIINGGMDIWQRGTSFAPIANGGYTADRWQATASVAPSSRTVQQIALAGAIPDLENVDYYLRSTINTIGSGTNPRMRHFVENVSTLAGKTVTLSWYGKQNIAGNYRVWVVQNFGTGGSTSVTVSDTNVTYSTSWNRYSVTFTMPSILGKTVGPSSYILIDLFQAATTGNVLEITGVQLEEGSSTTVFRRNASSIQAELAACQRYYVKFSGSLKTPYNIFNSGNCQTGSIFFPVTMRIAPTSVVVSDSAGTVGKVTIANAGGTQQTNITPPAAMDIYPGWWGYNSGGMGGTTGSTGMMFFNSYEANAEF